MTPLKLAILGVVVAASLSTQTATAPTTPITGVVITVAGRPVPNANVQLIRHYQAPEQGEEGFKILGKASTDADGRFDLGAVDLMAEIVFPHETAVRYEYKVFTSGQQRDLEGVDSTTSRRPNSSAIATISVRLKVSY